MKKRVKTKADLERMALARGAVISGPNGVKFNSDRETSIARPKAVAPTRPAVVSEKPKAPAPAAPADQNAGLRESMREIAASITANSMVTQDLIEQMQKQKPLPAPGKTPARKWFFDVERDSRGLIKRIVATNADLN